MFRVQIWESPFEIHKTVAVLFFSPVSFFSPVYLPKVSLCGKAEFFLKSAFQELLSSPERNGKIFCNRSNSPRDNLPKQSWD